MMDYIDIYCERLAPGIFAEPLNLLSNAAFFIAAFAAWKLARDENRQGPHAALLIALLFCIGIGSTLFHTLALGWAQLADVLPILLFQLAFVVIYARRVIRLDWRRSMILLLVFVGLVRVAEGLPAEILNGSLAYAPALIFLAGLGAYHAWKKKREPYILLAAAGMFIVSLAFRSVDMAVCEILPVGVHYIWHALNAVVLYLSLRGLFKNA